MHKKVARGDIFEISLDEKARRLSQLKPHLLIYFFTEFILLISR